MDIAPNEIVRRRQQRFLEALSQLAEGNCFTNTQRLFWNGVCSRRWCKAQACEVIRLQTAFKDALRETRVSQREVVEVESYRGCNNNVRDLQHYLEHYLSPSLLGAYVHGSLATEEEVNYSDFDALLILRDSVFGNTSRLAEAVNRIITARVYLWRQDPFQHHGFFVISETDLCFYPDYVFPDDLFAYAKALLPQSKKLMIGPSQPDCRQEMRLRRILDALQRKTKSESQPTSAFEVKLFISQLLLLPCLFLQALGQPTYKRYSFDRAKAFFSESEWNAIVVASHLRTIWPKQRPSRISALAARIGNTFLSTMIEAKYGRPAEPVIAVQLTDCFYRDVNILVGAMRSRLKEMCTQDSRE